VTRDLAPERPGSGVTLREAIDRFISHKRALNRRFLTEEQHLRLFARVLAERGVTDLHDVTTEVVHAFVLERPRHRPRSFNHLIGLLRRLFAFLQRQDLMMVSPLTLRPRRVTHNRIPFIFDIMPPTVVFPEAMNPNRTMLAPATTANPRASTNR